MPLTFSFSLASPIPHGSLLRQALCVSLLRSVENNFLNRDMPVVGNGSLSVLKPQLTGPPFRVVYVGCYEDSTPDRTFLRQAPPGGFMPCLSSVLAEGYSTFSLHAARGAQWHNLQCRYRLAAPLGRNPFVVRPDKECTSGEWSVTVSGERFAQEGGQGRSAVYLVSRDSTTPLSSARYAGCFSGAPSIAFSSPYLPDAVAAERPSGVPPQECMMAANVVGESRFALISQGGCPSPPAERRRPWGGRVRKGEME